MYWANDMLQSMLIVNFDNTLTSSTSLNKSSRVFLVQRPVFEIVDLQYES